MPEELPPSVSWQDYNKTLQTLPKAKLIDLFQSKHIRPVIVSNFLMFAEIQSLCLGWPSKKPFLLCTFTLLFGDHF